MTKKLSLNELKVQSFITSIGKTNAIIGGTGDPLCLDTRLPNTDGDPVCAPESDPECSFEICPHPTEDDVDACNSEADRCPVSYEPGTCC